MSRRSDIEFIINELGQTGFGLDFDDIIKTKTEFNYIVDNLNRDELISDDTAQNIYLSMDKRLKCGYIVCGSYRVNLRDLIRK